MRSLARRADCRDRPIRAVCTDQPVRALNRSRHAPARERAKERMGASAFRVSMRPRRRIERHGHRSPAQFRRDQMDAVPPAA